MGGETADVMACRTNARVRFFVPIGLALVFGACRKGSDLSNVGQGAIPITPSFSGNQGCNGPDQSFVAPVQAYASAVIGPMSQIAAPRGAELLFLTAADGSVRELDFSAGTPPAERVLVSPGVLDALLASIGIAEPAVLSGVCVLDASNLLVVEHTSNTILLVSRLVPDDVELFIGFPDPNSGFADGAGAQVRFSFTEATQLVATADGTVFVADTGNHALRRITIGVLPVVQTLAGTGAAFFEDGELFVAGFDSPVAVSIGCDGSALVVESGSSGLGGHRLRSVGVGAPAFFGGFNGSVLTLAGDGTAETVEGAGEVARLAAPRGLASSSGGEIYWVDSATGILRRYATTSGSADCPLFADCNAAVTAGGSFTPGGGFSMAISDSGALYVLDADGGELLRVSP